MPHCGGMEINMSINIKQQVKCPKCGQMSDVTVWQSVTAQDITDFLRTVCRRDRLSVSYIRPKEA